MPVPAELCCVGSSGGCGSGLLLKAFVGCTTGDVGIDADDDDDDDVDVFGVVVAAIVELSLTFKT